LCYEDAGACDLWEQYFTRSAGKSPTGCRARRGRGPLSPRTARGGPSAGSRSPLAPPHAQNVVTGLPLGRRERELLREPGRVMNLTGAFDSVARTSDWVTAVTELAVIVLLVEATAEQYSTRTSPTPCYTPPRRCTEHAALAAGASTSTALPPQRPLVACIP